MHYDHQVHTLYYHHIYILVFFHVFVYVFVYSLLLRCMFKVKLLACGSEDVTQYNTVYLFMRRFSIKLSFFFSLEKQRRVISARWGVVFIFINNSIKLKYKVTLWVHKPRKKSYISSVVFVINLNWKKAGYFIYFSKLVNFTRCVCSCDKKGALAIQGMKLITIFIWLYWVHCFYVIGIF